MFSRYASGALIFLLLMGCGERAEVKVSNGPAAAAAVEGPPVSFENEVKPVLEKFCENIFHVGGPGSGHKIKLVYNFVAMAHAAICCESLAACARVGISLESFFQLVSAGGANSTLILLMSTSSSSATSMGIDV